MKRTILLLMVTIILSCGNPAAPAIDNPILGSWLRNDEVITFYTDGDFTFHDYYTLDQYYYGFYIDYGDSVYLEVYEDGASQQYWYSIVEEGADTILRWKSSGMMNTVDYLKM